MEFQIKERYDINDLVKIIEMLRDPENGCPWDKVLTHKTIRKNFIEDKPLGLLVHRSRQLQSEDDYR